MPEVDGWRRRKIIWETIVGARRPPAAVLTYGTSFQSAPITISLDSMSMGTMVSQTICVPCVSYASNELRLLGRPPRELPPAPEIAKRRARAKAARQARKRNRR